MNTKSNVPFVEEVDTRFLESLLGYNARRTALVLIEPFLERMAIYDLRPVDFSVLSLITHNPHTSRQLCSTLYRHPTQWAWSSRWRSVARSCASIPMTAGHGPAPHRQRQEDDARSRANRLHWTRKWPPA
jgi:hypothetical protein